MKKYFITGTDTGVGKTISSAVLTLGLQANYWKPIQTGIADEIADQDIVSELTQLSSDHFFPSRYLLKASLSPDQAAHLENMTLEMGACEPPSTEKILIIEGAGGVYVPLNHTDCLLDLMKKINAPVIVVSRGTLGTINHTLLTLSVLRQHGLIIHGIIFCGHLNPDNQIAIEKWGKVPTLFHIPFFEKINSAILTAWVADHHALIRKHFL